MAVPAEMSDGMTLACLTESDMGTNGVDMMTGRVKNGPQMHPLVDRLRAYGGEHIVTRRLAGKFAVGSAQIDVRREWRRRFYDFFETHGRAASYDLNLPRMFASTGRMNADVRSIDYICTQWVADALVHMGIMVERQNPENYTLQDFTCEGQLPLYNGLAYGPHIYVAR